MKQKLVVVGNGMAGMYAVEELLKKNPDAYSITVFGAEPRVNYNRIMLSPLLAGEKTFDDIVINTKEWYSENDITLLSGDKIVTINRDKKFVTSQSGLTVFYDRLILATGSDPFIIPVPGSNLDGVVTFRDVDDVEAMLSAAQSHSKAVVIGGGLLGLEAAHGLSLNGMDVTVIHLMETLMERQLDEAASFLLKRELQGRDIEVLTSANTAEIFGSGRVAGVKLKDGRTIEADLVVMAVGIRPSVQLAADSGLEIGRGVKVDDGMQTSDPAIYAVGECVEHREQVYGLVAPLYEMGRVLADRLSGGESLYEGSVTSTKLKVTGVDVFSAGEFNGGGGTEDIVFRDASRGVYKRLVIKDDRIKGAVLYGDTTDGAWYFQMLREQQDIADIRDVVVFGQAFVGGAPTAPHMAVAALSDDAEICGCNGVCKGDITSAISDNGLTSLEEVRAHTKASASCGSCTGLVEQLLQVSLGDDYTPNEVQPMCGCTHHSHDDIRRVIVAKKLMTMPEVMQELEWTTPTGCASCAPALNYYLLCAWTGEYQDDWQARHINERAHANIQKDGTFSVVPRMWGGLTNPKELRAIADVADKFDIPTIKVTGGQRIDLFGIKKEDLPAVWSDLNDAGMVSGHAYGKSLRTVKTCVGSEWCPFGTQSSLKMGIQLERMCWGAWAPHKFKMAVSGCPRNCAEATIKDFGVVAVDSGWELHVGGNGGIKVRVTDLLCKVETEAEVRKYAGAFMQLYREEAHYLERTAPWIERVGLDHVKEKMVEDAQNRDTLFQRFIDSQKVHRRDPWEDRAKYNVDKQEFTPLAVVA